MIGSRRSVRDVGRQACYLTKQDKVAYHAWGGFASPLLVALLVAAEHVAGIAGFSPGDARRKMLPIMRQTISNYAKLGPAGAFSGPLVRGDAAVVGEHLRVLRKVPVAREVYVALARAALQTIPVQYKKELAKVIELGTTKAASPGKRARTRPARSATIRQS